jgi:integrase
MDLIQEFIDYKSRQKNGKGKLISKHTLTSYKSQLSIYKKEAGAMPKNKGKHNRFILNTEDYLYQLKNDYTSQENSKGNSFRTRLAIIKSFFDFLIAEKRDLKLIIKGKPMDLTTFPFNALKKAVNANKTSKIWLNDTELKKLETHIRDETKTSLRDRLIFEIALSTAARRTEIQSLRECDVTAEKDRNGNTGYYMNTLMKGKGTRTMVDISKGLYDLIKQFNSGTSENYIFVTKESKAGEAINLSYITQLVIKISKKALGYQITPHELRHTAVNQLIIYLAKKGYDLEHCIREAQKLAGHSSPNTTESHYFNDEVKGKFRVYSVDTNRERYRDI